ncbi:restriction endonuclease subunit S [Finegoldia dalianensis]|uniref:Restriction endonuclease subunit S n=1 Tax=Finegoldia dalianensis TaxID=3145239 RepID=A0ABW9KHX3_9FIRM
MEFKKVTLGEIAKFNQKSYKSNYNWKTVKYLDTGNLNKNKVENLTTFNLRKEKLPSRAKRIPQINSILYSTVRPNQEHYGILENKFDNLLVSTGFTVIDIYKENINPKYIYYFLTKKDITAYLQKIAEDSVSTYPAIKPSDIKNLEILLPNRNNQDKIEQILSNLDSKIEINNKIISNLESQAQAIFKSWFVDFEPFQDGNFVESELGMIPKGWEVKELGEVADCKLGGTPSRKKREFWNGDIPWINSGEVNKDRIIEPSEYITEDGLKNSATKLLKRKTTLVAITGATLGQVSLLEIDCCTNQSIIGIEPNEKIPYEYIYLFIKNNINKIISNQTGAAQQHINLNDIRTSKIIIPQSRIMTEYVKIVSLLMSKVEKNYFENTKLAELRDALLPKLMAGEIDVSNIKIEGEEVKNE